MSGKKGKPARKLTRLEEFRAVWGDRNPAGDPARDPARLNELTEPGYCGALTVRELAAVAAVDPVNYPQGLDTPICVGDAQRSCTSVVCIEPGGVGGRYLSIRSGTPRKGARGEITAGQVATILHEVFMYLTQGNHDFTVQAGDVVIKCTEEGGAK